MLKNKSRQKYILLLIATIISLMALWGVLDDVIPLTYLGEIGGVPMVLINGLHGGRTSGIDAIGYAVFVAVNIAFYYALFFTASRSLLK